MPSTFISPRPKKILVITPAYRGFNNPIYTEPFINNCEDMGLEYKIIGDNISKMEEDEEFIKMRPGCLDPNDAYSHFLYYKVVLLRRVLDSILSDYSHILFVDLKDTIINNTLSLYFTDESDYFKVFISQEINEWPPKNTINMDFEYNGQGYVNSGCIFGYIGEFVRILRAMEKNIDKLHCDQGAWQWAYHSGLFNIKLDKDDLFLNTGGLTEKPLINNKLYAVIHDNGGSQFPIRLVDNLRKQRNYI